MLIVDKAEIEAGFALAEKEGIIDRYIKRMFPNGLPEEYRKKDDLEDRVVAALKKESSTLSGAGEIEEPRG